MKWCHKLPHGAQAKKSSHFERRIACLFLSLQDAGCWPEHHGPATWLSLMSNKLLICCPKRLWKDFFYRLRWHACTISPPILHTILRWRNGLQIQADIFDPSDDSGILGRGKNLHFLICSGWLGTDPNRPKEKRMPANLRFNELDAHIGYSGNTHLETRKSGLEHLKAKKKVMDSGRKFPTQHLTA